MKTARLASMMAIAVCVFASATVFAHDELYYSAAMCTPAWQHGYDGSSEEGFRWIVSGAYWQNNDTDNDEWLICPIPFDRSKTGPFEVRVLVYDTHGAKSVIANVTRQSNIGAPVVADAAASGDSDTGMETLFLIVQPTSGDRWINLYIKVPDRQSEWGSRVYGYRVCRNCN